jgi:glycosyltransferase involved in cell wall biosynthesis
VTRLLLVTGLWPTADHPQAGVFVKRRVGGEPITVVAPTSYAGPIAIRYLRLTAAALVRRGRFDGVEAHPLFPAGLIGLLAARIRRVPLMTYAHGADVRETALENPVYRALARLVVRGSAAVVTNSTDTATLVAQLGGRATVIPPGVDLAAFRPMPRPRQGRVLYVGGSDPRKGWHVARDLADTCLGPGLRTVDPSEMPDLMAAHDVVLVPSVAEPFGLVAAEAIASGRWVVARAVGGLREVVEDGVTGTLVESDEAFRSALAAVPDYEPEAVAAQAARFSLERANAAMAEVWERILASR